MPAQHVAPAVRSITSSSVAAKFSSTTIASAPESTSWCSSSRAVYSGLTLTTTQPARNTAAIATMYCGTLGIISATRAPRASPSDCSQAPRSLRQAINVREAHARAHAGGCVALRVLTKGLLRADRPASCGRRGRSRPARWRVLREPGSVSQGRCSESRSTTVTACCAVAACAATVVVLAGRWPGPPQNSLATSARSRCGDLCQEVRRHRASRGRCRNRSPERPATPTARPRAPAPASSRRLWRISGGACRRSSARADIEHQVDLALSAGRLTGAPPGCHVSWRQSTGPCDRHGGPSHCRVAPTAHAARVSASTVCDHFVRE